MVRIDQWGWKHPDGGSGEEIEINDPKYIPSAWSEPHPQGTPPDASADPEESKSQYPFNHVFESESGHVREMERHHCRVGKVFVHRFRLQ